MPFLNDLYVEIIEGGYRVTRALVYRDPSTGGEIRVPRGFETDFASIPDMFRWLVDGHGDSRRPAVIHDYLYKNGIGKRKQADGLFYQGLLEEGMPKWKAYLCYMAVRVGGVFSWGNN